MTDGNQSYFPMTGDYTLCGWRVQSDWPVPELPPWTGDDRPPDILIRLGKVPARLPGQVVARPLVQVNDEGLARFSLEEVAAYLIRDGREITIDTRLPADAPDVGLFLFGTVFGILCHQRGLLPLHACCVAFGDRAYAFAGSSGTGKSTLAAALVACGGRLVADDVTVIEFRDGFPMVLPSFPRQKLWRNTLDAMAIAPGRRLRSTAVLEKFEHSQTEHFEPAPIRLAAVTHLERARQQSVPTEKPLKGREAFVAVQEQIYRRPTARLLGREPSLFSATGALIATTRQTRLWMPNGLEALLPEAPALAERLRRDGA